MPLISFDPLFPIERMGDYKYDKPHKFDAPKLFSVKCKGSPGNGAELSQSMDMSTGKDGAIGFKHKAELKKKFNDEHSLKFTATSADYEMEYEMEPEALNKDGMHGQVEVKAKCLPATNGWEGSAEVKVGGFELGPIKPYTQLEFGTNNKKEHSITYGQNLVYDGNFHCAWKLHHDLKALTEAYGLLALKNTPYGHFYFRSNCLNRFVGLGCAYKVGEHGHHATEIQYDFKDAKAAGMFDMPLFWRFGGVYNTQNGMKGSLSAYFGKKWMVQQKWEVPFSKSTKVTFQDQGDIKAMFTDPKNASLKFGIALEYKL